MYLEEINITNYENINETNCINMTLNINILLVKIYSIGT